MGFVIQCRDAGVPERLLIPIRPPFMNVRDNKLDGGKIPSVPGNFGEWFPLDDWQKCDTPWAVKEEADIAGANAGLILGCSSAAENGVNYAAIDIDLKEGQEIDRDRLVNSFSMLQPGKSLLVRETVRWRAMLLVRIADAFDIGRKSRYIITSNNEEIGAVELLTTGQQCVIAGIHYLGNPIQWGLHGSDDRYPSPILDADIPVFDTFLDLATQVSAMLERLAGAGYTFEAASVGHGGMVADTDLVPNWLTLDQLIQYIKNTPNEKNNSRDSYVAFMEAVAACKVGIETRDGPLAPELVERLSHTVADWAAKWPGNANVSDAYAIEKAKVDNDWFKQRGQFSTNFDRLTVLSRDFGYPDAVNRSAQFAFADNTTETKPIPSPQDSGDINIVRIGASFSAPQGSEHSDLTVSQHIASRAGVGQVVAYLPRESRWILMDGKKKGWVDDKTNAVKWRVAQEQIEYTSKFGGGPTPWTKGEINAMMSVRKTYSIMDALSDILAKDDDMIKDSTYMLQTSGVTYDLRNGKPISLLDRKLRFDTRYSKVAPAFGSNWGTPLFDNLLLGLADDNEEVVEWLWHYLGYCLLGDPRADCFVVIWGPGRNGKSVLSYVLTNILGDYHLDLNSHVLMQSGEKLHATSLNRLRNKRLAIATEVPKNAKWNEMIIKQITGGDKLLARNMRENETEFRCEAGLLVLCNDLPKFDKATPAILRRYRLIGTTKTPEFPDPSLKEKIVLQEGGAILAKLMKYAQKVFNEGGQPHEHVVLPPVPAVMNAEVAEAMSDGDPMFAWMNAECATGPGYANCEESLDELRSRFDAWVARNSGNNFVGETTEKSFKDALRGFNGIMTKDTKGQPLRKSMRVGPSTVKVSVARGIKLKVKAVAA